MPQFDSTVYAEKARDILNHLLELGEFPVTGIQEAVADDQLEFHMESEDNARLIGRTSQTLDALQFLLNRLLSRQFEDAPYCVLDVGGYRAERRERILADAMEGLEQVRRTGRPWRMPPLNAMDRRVVHHALAQYDDVVTESGAPDDRGRKRILIAPAGYRDGDSFDDASGDAGDGGVPPPDPAPGDDGWALDSLVPPPEAGDAGDQP